MNGNGSGDAGPSPSTSSFSPVDSPLNASGAYTDYALVSSLPSSVSGWRHNVLKFAVDRPINPQQDGWPGPVRMNRKDPRVVRRLTEDQRARIVAERQRAAAVKAGVSMDVDMKLKVEEEVVEDKKPVKREREQRDLSLVGGSAAAAALAAPPPKPAQGKGGMFKKKTKRVFVTSDEARRLKREEWAPWVLEDREGQHRWVGHLEGGAGEFDEAKPPAPGSVGNKGWRPTAAATDAGGSGSSYVAFVQEGDGFRLVPVNRWYKFSRGPQYATLGTEEAEDEYNRQQKSTEDSRWMMHRRFVNSLPKTAQSATSSDGSRPATPRTTSAAAAGPSIRHRLLDKSASLLKAPRQEQGKAMRVKRGASRGEVEDDELQGRGRSANREVEQQEEGEFDYDEEFADDEEGIAVIDDLADEQEAKELEEKMKREMRGATGLDNEVPTAEEDEDAPELTNTGKEIKKLVRKADKDGLYDSDNDEEDNPYFSGSEYTDEAASVASLDLNGDTPAARSGSATPQTRPHPSVSKQRERSDSRSRQTSAPPSRPGSRGGSRSGSPVPGSGSGAAVVAKRATSPDAGRRSASTSRATSPGVSGKRKRGDAAHDADAKRRKNASPSPPPAGDSSAATGDYLLTKEKLLSFLKSRAEPFTTQEVLKHFKKAIKLEPRNKDIMLPLLQSVADLKGSSLIVRPGL